VIAVGLVLAAVSTVAINGGYALQHAAAGALPPLGVRTVVLFFRDRRWLAGFLGGIVGWVLYVVALRLAPLSLVQAAAAGGIAVLAIGTRLHRPERIGVAAALAGLVLLASSIGSGTASTHGAVLAVALWMAGSVVAAAALARISLGTTAGVLYAAGDVGTKAAVVGGARLWFVPALLACHGLAFVAMQLAFQRGRRLASAGVAVLWTNALPIAAGMALFREPYGGPLRVAAFVLVVVAAVALAKAPAEAAAPSPA
jgi:hypothetical protein